MTRSLSGSRRLPDRAVGLSMVAVPREASRRALEGSVAFMNLANAQPPGIAAEGIS